ncbi:hypothetical protein Avbf_12384 [Armadillidium vulgare]|nr:hypothetical protein Avbf_12384 [Armadillidium vulgare]
MNAINYESVTCACVSSLVDETSLNNLHITESENILKQITNNFQSPTQQISNSFDPLADLSLWMRPMNSQKNFLLNSTFSIDEKPTYLHESPLKAVDSAEKDKTLQLLLESYLNSLVLKSIPPSVKGQHTDLTEIIKTIDKLDNSYSDLSLPFDPYNANFIGSSNLNKNSFPTQNNPFSSSSFTNFSQSNGNGIPPEVLANLLVRLRVPTVEEIASVLPDTTRITPHLSTALADFLSNISDAIAKFITDVQAALAQNPILGVLLALAILAIIWHHFPYKFEKKKKGYGYGHDPHHGGGYHRREDTYPQFRSFDSHGIDILVNVLNTLEQLDIKFTSTDINHQT